MQTFHWGRSARSVRIGGPRLLADKGQEKVGAAFEPGCAALVSEEVHAVRKSQMILVTLVDDASQIHSSADLLYGLCASVPGGMGLWRKP